MILAIQLYSNFHVNRIMQSKTELRPHDHAYITHSQRARPTIFETLAANLAHALVHKLMESLLRWAVPPITVPKAADPGLALIP